MTFAYSATDLYACLNVKRFSQEVKHLDYRLFDNDYCSISVLVQDCQRCFRKFAGDFIRTQGSQKHAGVHGNSPLSTMELCDTNP